MPWVTDKRGVFGYLARVKHMANVLVIAKQPSERDEGSLWKYGEFFPGGVIEEKAGEKVIRRRRPLRLR